MLKGVPSSVMHPERAIVSPSRVPVRLATTILSAPLSHVIMESEAEMEMRSSFSTTAVSKPTGPLMVRLFVMAPALKS